jgi:hypothetical protein
VASCRAPSSIQEHHRPHDMTCVFYSGIPVALNDLKEYREAHKRVIALLESNIGKAVEVTTVDGTRYTVVIDNVDSEGFVHSIDGEFFWMAFDSVLDITPVTGAQSI